MDEPSSPYDKALHWLKAGVDSAEIENRLKATGLNVSELNLLLAAATNTVREEERRGVVAPPQALVPSTVITVLKVIGAVVAFAGLLGVGFLLVALVVGSVWGWH